MIFSSKSLIWFSLLKSYSRIIVCQSDELIDPKICTAVCQSVNKYKLEYNDFTLQSWSSLYFPQRLTR